MKNVFKTFAILFLAIVSMACNKEDDFVFDAKSLAQTAWIGSEVITNSGQVIRTKGVDMQFLTTTEGQCVMNEDGVETEVYTFKYSIKGKIMKIEDTPLDGKRTLLVSNNDKIILEMFSSYTVRLTLSRRY